MKYLRIFFTFLGYCTFVALVGAATFFYIGYLKGKKAVESNITFKEVQMTPAKEQPVTIEPLPEPPPQVTPRPRKTAPVSVRKTAPVSVRKTAAVSAPVSVPVSAPVTYTVPVSKKTRTATASKPAAPVRKAKHKQKPETYLPPITLTYRVTDNSANPRTGRGVVNPYETTDLERQVIQRMEDLEQLKKAAEQIRNPPVHESGIVKLFSGN